MLKEDKISLNTLINVSFGIERVSKVKLYELTFASVEASCPTLLGFLLDIGVDPLLEVQGHSLFALVVYNSCKPKVIQEFLKRDITLVQKKISLSKIIPPLFPAEIAILLKPTQQLWKLRILLKALKRASNEPQILFEALLLASIVGWTEAAELLLKRGAWTCQEDNCAISESIYYQNIDFLKNLTSKGLIDLVKCPHSPLCKQ